MMIQFTVYLFLNIPAVSVNNFMQLYGSTISPRYQYYLLCFVYMHAVSFTNINLNATFDK